MTVDRIENKEYILQNTLTSHSPFQIKIPLKRQYYATYEMMEECLDFFNDYVFYGPNNEFLTLANEKFNMKEKTWYLLPQAYSIALTPVQL